MSTTCRPWIKVYCRICEQGRWRVVRRKENLRHWLCLHCYYRVLQITHADWAEQWVGRPLDELEGTLPAMQEPIFRREQAFANFLTLLECRKTNNITCMLFDIIKVYKKYHIINNNQIIGKECGSNIPIPRSWTVSPENWEREKQRWWVR